MLQFQAQNNCYARIHITDFIFQLYVYDILREIKAQHESNNVKALLLNKII